MDTNTLILIGLLIIAGVVAFAIWRNKQVKAEGSAGPVTFKVDTAREQEGAAQPAPPTASLKAGNVSGSKVTTEATGSAEAEVKDITDSTVVTRGGASDKPQ